MVIQLRSKDMYRVMMGTKIESNSAVEKLKYFNKLYEAFMVLCISVSRDILFHVYSITAPNKFWINIDSLFGNIDEMRGCQIENELISLRPNHF